MAFSNSLANAAKYNPLNGLTLKASTANALAPAAKTSGLGGSNGFFLLNPTTSAPAPPPPQTQTNAAPPPSGSSGFSAPNIDWASLINGDYALGQGEAGLNASNAEALAQRNALIRAAYAQFGDNLDLGTLAQQLGLSQADLQNVIDPATQQLAKESTDSGVSTVARINAANALENRNIINSLNARGILNSGETGYQTDQQNLTYRQQQYDARAKLLQALEQYQQGYLSVKNANAQALANLLSAAADRIYGLYGGMGFGGGGGGGGGQEQPQAQPQPIVTNYSSNPNKPLSGPSIFAFK